MNDEFYMQRAIELAKRGEGFVSPNPLVGAVIVKDGKIIGEGWHERCGELHAERNALKNCKNQLKALQFMSLLSLAVIMAERLLAQKQLLRQNQPSSYWFS